MKKLLLALLFLFPSLVSAQLTVPQGGTGVNFISPGGFLVGSTTLRTTASSSPTVGWLFATSTTATSTFNGNGYFKGNLRVDGNLFAPVVLQIAGITQGSVLFAGAGGTVAQKNANFFWDDTNNRLGIGTTTPPALLTVAASGGASGIFEGTIGVGRSSIAPTGVSLMVGNGSSQTTPNGGGSNITAQVQNIQTSGTAAITVGVGDGTNNRRASLFSNQTDALWGLSSTYSSVASNFTIDMTGTRRLTILEASGNVGIGTTNPSLTKLQVLGSASFGVSTSGQTIFLESQGAPNYGSAAYLVTDWGATQGAVRLLSQSNLSGGTGIGTASKSNLAIQYSTNAGAYNTDPNALTYATALVVDGNNGNVGIGITAPTTKFVVVDSTANGSGGVFAETGTGTAYGIQSTATGAGSLNTGGYFLASGATSNYGIRIAGPAAGGANYAVYSTAAAQSYFAGNVGIGNTSPGAKLDVAGGIRTTDLSAAASGTGVELGYFISGDYGVINAYNRTGSAYKQLRIDGLTTIINSASGGNVGIGTTTPGQKLVITGTSPTAEFYDSSGSNRSALFGHSAGNAVIDSIGGGWTIIKSGGTSNVSFTNGGGAFGSYAGVNAPPSNGLIVSGNVGIGTTSPSSTLSVQGDMLVTGNTLRRQAGAAATVGNATLVAGTVTVSTTAAKANSYVMLTRKTSGGTIGTSITYTISAGTSFTITSDNILDTSTFSYLIVDGY